MLKLRHLRKGDKIAIVSLSSGILGEKFIEHELNLGIQRLNEFGLKPVFMSNALKGIEYIKQNPKARAADLKEAFMDTSIAAIICAIGGDDTYLTLPYLMNDDFREIVYRNPKIFLGFSDSTINHFMFYRLNLPTFYGQAFIPDFCELDSQMLPYTRSAFSNLFKIEFDPIISSPIWYLERNDFSSASLGVPRISKKETRGYEVLQGKGNVDGILLGGCLDSIYDILTGIRYSDEKIICEKYNIFPLKEEWSGKILLLETSEEQPAPQLYKAMLLTLKEKGVFDNIVGILHGKPMDEKYYEEYKSILVEIVNNPKLPILFNLNIGHATPRGILPLQAKIRMDLDNKKVEILENTLF